MLGIGDASEYDTNERTNWNIAARRGCSWGLVRAATTGRWSNGKPTLKKDSMFDMNFQRMGEAGLKRAVYAWFDPRVKLVPAQTQAEHFLECVNKTGIGELGTVLDLEDAGTIRADTRVGDHILTWLVIVEQETRKRPLLYLNASYAHAYLFNTSIHCDWLTDYEIIIASWRTNAPNVPLPWGPERWRAWQYTDLAPGEYYGFYAADSRRQAPNICLALWRE